MVERRDPVGGHEQQVVLVDAVQLADLAAGQVGIVGQSGTHRVSLTAAGGHLCWDRNHEIALPALRHHPGTADRPTPQRPADRGVDHRVGARRCGVHHAIATFARVGTGQEGATGISANLGSAGDSADRLPLVGDALAKPLRAASEAALDLAGAGQNLNSTATWLAVLLAIAVAGPPILAVGMPWLFLRIRFFRRKWTVIALAQTPAGQQLLALRALANRPLRKLTEVSHDPVGAWRREDPMAVRGLAALELRSAGVAG